MTIFHALESDFSYALTENSAILPDQRAGLYLWEMILKLRLHPYLLLSLVAVALLVSIWLNFILFGRGRQYYLELNETRLDPLGLSYYASENERNPAESAKMTVVFFGDSRVTDWPSPSVSGRFQFVNRGIGAQTSAQTLQRFNYHVKPLHPDIIILQVGINDLKTIPLFPERKEAIIANCKQNIRQIVTQSVNIGAVVILTTIFPAGEIPLERRLFWSPAVDQAIEEVNAYIRSLEAHNVIILNAYLLLTNQETVRQVYRDELHLNAKGYEVLNGELVHVLMTLDSDQRHSMQQLHRDHHRR
ncbi:MAG: GDSL-type esterase/lipase family protein [Anaerolineae bacterium]|nr:GDSL-type esterase/lipase family protein [Anaerolineae bacterium]